MLFIQIIYEFDKNIRDKLKIFRIFLIYHIELKQIHDLNINNYQSIAAIKISSLLFPIIEYAIKTISWRYLVATNQSYFSNSDWSEYINKYKIIYLYYNMICKITDRISKVFF